jgi:hypothetical protein
MSDAGRGRWAQRVRHFVAGTFVVFLHISGDLSSYEKVRNRFFRQWDRGDALAFVLDVLLVGLFVTALFEVLNRPRWPRVRGTLRAVFVLALVSGIVSNIEPLHRPHFVFFDMLWLGIAAVAGYSYGRPQSRLVRFSYRSALVFSPLILILFIQAFTWTTWNPPDRPLQVRYAPRAATPVFVFIFDEWSFPRAIPGGAVPPNLPHLQQLASQALFFKAARSPGDDTYRSLPLLIYGDHPLHELPLVFAKEGKEGREYVTGPQPEHPVQNVFQLARAGGYNAAMVGFYLPYEIMLGDSMSYCRGFSYYPTASTLLGRMALHGFESLRFETDPLTRHLFRIAHAQLFTWHWLQLRDQMRDGIATAIDRLPANTFTFIHYPLPHAPFVFNEDGAFRGVYRIDFDRPTGYADGAGGTVEEYQRQLAYLDHVIGGLMDQLRKAGKFDDALIIMTSDHSWRYDPDTRLRAETRRWVPLLVKLPGQHRGLEVETPFPNTKLSAFVRHTVSGNSGDPEVEALISRAEGHASTGPGAAGTAAAAN